MAKYVAFLAGLPYYAAPTSLSNDGFSSPQSSLTIAGRRRSLAAALPFAVVLDLDVCKDAPRPLWLSGIGDLVSKLTAIFDWKLAFHCRGEPVNDFAALLSDATVYQFLAQPSFDLDGARLLGTALLLNGIAMEICGSSRPASGSEHLISHALDSISKRPRLHGLQVGVATYVISRVQNNQSERIARLFDQVGFWSEIRSDPFSLSEWQQAIDLAPSIKDDFYTILSEEEAVTEARESSSMIPGSRGVFFIERVKERSKKTAGGFCLTRVTLEGMILRLWDSFLHGIDAFHGVFPHAASPSLSRHDDHDQSSTCPVVRIGYPAV